MTDEELIALMVFYLTSVSARRMQYCYFNFAGSNTVVVSNSTTKSSAPHGDRLMQFSVGELGFHIIKFKDENVLTRFKELLHIPSDKYYCVQIVKLMSVLKKGNLSSLDITMNNNSELYVDGVKYGSILYDFHVIMMIEIYIDTINQALRNKNVMITDIDLKPEIDGNVYYTKIDPNDLRDKNGPSWESRILKFPCVDGLTTVSLKTFIPKIKHEYLFKRYFWYEDIRIYSFARFSDEHVDIVTFRPNIVLIPIPTKTDIDDGVK